MPGHYCAVAQEGGLCLKGGLESQWDVADRRKSQKVGPTLREGTTAKEVAVGGQGVSRPQAIQQSAWVQARQVREGRGVSWLLFIFSAVGVGAVKGWGGGQLTAEKRDVRVSSRTAGGSPGPRAGPLEVRGADWHHRAVHCL